MSALAFYFMEMGDKVYGYDLTPSPITDQLIAKGAEIHFEENIEKIPEKVDLVVYTPAVSQNHAEYQYFLKQQIPVFKRSEILGQLSSEKPTIAVAGTHGKTTTTALATHLLYPEYPVTAFIGGVAKNFDSNYVIAPNSEIVVVEADEYDRSFLTLSPSVAIITSMDADHLDIYHGKTNLEEAFQCFADKILPNGTLVIHEDIADQIEHPSKITYGFSENADCRADKIVLYPNRITFDLHYRNSYYPQLELGITGRYNLLNALAAIAALFAAYPQKEEQEMLPFLQKLKTFQGVKRRFDYQIYTDQLIYIDDYAHHPHEISSFLKSVKMLFPEKSLTAVFQPHLYSRTRDFADEFARSLELADKIILLDIYPAREEPIAGVSSAWLLSLIQKEDKRLLSKEELIPFLQKAKPEVLVTIGAGDIDRLVPILLQK